MNVQWRSKWVQVDKRQAHWCLRWLWKHETPSSSCSSMWLQCFVNLTSDSIAQVMLQSSYWPEICHGFYRPSLCIWFEPFLLKANLKEASVYSGYDSVFPQGRMSWDASLIRMASDLPIAEFFGLNQVCKIRCLVVFGGWIAAWVGPIRRQVCAYMMARDCKNKYHFAWGSCWLMNLFNAFLWTILCFRLGHNYSFLSDWLLWCVRPSLVGAEIPPNPRPR